MHKKYSAKGLSILAFPCNQFGAQEPKSENEIKEFVGKFKVEFDMFSKVEVNGDNEHPLFKFIKSKLNISSIKWNFTKFLVNRQGIPLKHFAHTVEPKDIENEIKRLLNEKY